MKEVVIIIVCIALALWFINRAKKLKNQSASKLSVLEHPSVFEKPSIEMVSSNPEKEKPSRFIRMNEMENEPGSA